LTVISLLHHCFFFFSRSNGTATDIGSLAPGHVLGLEIGRKE
jgi:hypothetical protein